MGNQKGMTPVEWLILLVIIGILATLAVPRLIDSSNKDICGEMLKEIYASELAYHSEHGVYSEHFGDLTLSKRGQELLKDHELSVTVYRTGMLTPNDPFEAASVRGRIKGVLNESGQIAFTKLK